MNLTLKSYAVSATSVSQTFWSIPWQVVLQWVVVVGIGLGLGGYVLAFSYLPQELAYLSLMAVLASFMLLIVGQVKRVLLAVILFELPIQMDIYLNYQPKMETLGVSYVGLNVSVTLLCLLILYGVWLAELLAREVTVSHAKSYVNIPLFIYMAIVFLTVVVAYDVEAAVYGIALLLQSLLLYIYIVHAVQTRADLLFVITMILSALVLESLIIILLRGAGQGIKIGLINARIDGTRVGGTVGGPNAAASYLALLMAPAFSLLITRLGRWYKWLAVIAFGLGGIALLFTESRGGFIAVAISLFLFCLFTWQRGWLSLVVPIIMVFFIVLALLVFQDALLSRMAEDDGGSAASRMPLNRLAFRMIQDHPLGVGINNFMFALFERRYPLENTRTWISAVHNRYLFVWAETGVGGLAAFIWFFLATIHRGWLCWRRGDRLLSPLALAFAVALAGQMIHMAVAQFTGRSQLQMQLLVAAIITAMYQMDGLRTHYQNQTKLQQ